jgi:NTP pyrophosphatase (non-canonical NTP hydrolase)
MKTINQWARDVHQNSRDHGWYDGVEDVDLRLVPEKLCLIHSEVSEALEVYREGKTSGLMTSLYDHDKGGKPVGFDSELADIIIRTMDLAVHLGIDIERAIAEKHAYNAKRPHRHGGKRC